MRRGRTLGWTVAALAGFAVAAHAIAPPDATYRGQKMCMMCHKTKTPEIVAKYVKSPMAMAMTDITDADKVADVLKADLASAPFGKDKVAYIFASGRHQQAFLDKDLMVLPQKWLVAEKKWVDTPAVDAGKLCVGCHTTGYNHTDRKWKSLGVGCEDCHGPGSAHVRSMKKDDILDPGDLKDAHVRAYICGQCHSKGMSKDGATPWPHDFRPGDDLTAAFNHDTVNGPGQNQQLNDLMGSEHWKNNVVCETCHDPHGDTGNPDQLLKPVIELCLSCHSKPDNKSNVVDMATHMAKVGRKPPADATCASCHMPGGRHLFSKEAAKASDVGK